MSDVLMVLDAGPGPEPKPPTPPAPVPAPAPQPDVAPAPDVLATLDAAPAAQPTRGMHAAAALGADVAPDQAAQAATLATRAGVDPAAVLPAQKQISAGASQAFDAQHYDDIAQRHPELAQWLTRPTNAAVARGDLANLRAISTGIQSLNPQVDDRPDLPLLSAFKVGALRQVNNLNRTLLAGPAWLQQETRALFGITSTPSPATPLGMVYGAWDDNRLMERQRAEFFKPSAARDLVSSAAGILADPTTTLLLPAEGASLAIKGGQVLGEAATAAKAIRGAALTQGVVAAGDTAISQADRQAQHEEAGNALAATANVAVQGALAYFFGKVGQEIPVLRGIGATPFTAKPGRELASDIVRNAVTGGSLSATAGAADAVINEGRLPGPGELAALYASGAIPGGLMAAAAAPEAAVAARHLSTLRHAEGLQFASKLLDVVHAVKGSEAAKAGPEQVGQLIDGLAGRGPSHVYLQADEWQAHFLAKGQDPVAEADRAGLKDEYIRARGLGGDMQVPLRAAIGMAVESENPAALVNQMRQAPTAPNAVEAATFFQAPDHADVEAARRLAADQAAAAGPAAPDTIAADRSGQALAAGLPASEAGVVGQLHQRFFERLAEHFNAAREDNGGPAVTADQLAEQFKVHIQRVLPEVLRDAVASGHIAPVLDQLRTKGPTTPQEHAAREALLNLGLDPTVQTNDEIAAALASRAAATPAAAAGATLEQPAAPGPRGSFTPGAGEVPALIRLFQGANRSTVFHETGHYFLDVLAKLSAREGAPKALTEDFDAILKWSGYGDRATLERTQAELGDLQAKIGTREPTTEERARLKELSAPHETFARGFEQYLMEGKAPATGLRRAFARLKAWMTSAYRDVKNLGVELTPEVRGVFDRLLASQREIERAKARVGEEPAFADQASSGMGDRQWAKYQAQVAEAQRQESEHLERALMAHERTAASEAYAADRLDVRRQVADQVGQEKVHDAIRQLQDGETWDGRKIAAPIKLAKADVERLLTPEERQLLPGPGREKNRGRPIVTPEEHGLSADAAAALLGYESGHALLQDIIRAPDRERLVDYRTDEAMAAKYPDPMQHQGTIDHEADVALHESDARAEVMDLERQQLAKLLDRERAAAADEAQRQALAKDRGQADAALKKQAGKVADAMVRQVERQQTAEEVAAERARVQAERDALKAGTSRDQRAAMRVAAGELIADAKTSAIDPDRYIAAERRAAIAGAKAMQAKDYATALTMKRAQMMNAELARAAARAVDQLGKDQAALLKSATDDGHRARIAKAGGWEWTVSYPDGTTKTFDQPDAEGRSSQEQARAEAILGKGTYERTSGYLDQVDALLERFDLKTRTPGDLRRRASLRDFLDRARTFVAPDGERFPSGAFADIPEHLIDDVRRTNIADMTVTDVHDLRRAVAGIEQMAALKNALIKSTGKHRIDNIATSVAAQLKLTGKPNVKGSDGTTGLLDGPLRFIGNFFRDLMSIPRLVHEMDGLKEAGPLAKAFLHPAIEAGDAELRMKAEIRERVSKAIDTWGKKNDPTLHFRRQIPGVDRSMSYLNRIVTLMHYGNVEGRQRLRDLNGWDDAAVHRIVDTLDAKDIAFANTMVDILSAHWSDVKALEEKYNGIAPPKVEAVPVELPNGSYKGGYQRIYYDGESATTLEQMAQHMREDGMTGGGYRRPATARGATKERVETVKERVLSLDPGGWTRAMNEAIHDITHRDLVVDQMKLLAHPDVRKAMLQHWGQGIYKQFINQTMGLAQGNKPAVTSAEKIAEYLRVSTNYSRRAFNPAYAMIQEAGLVLARARVKDRYLLGAQMQLISGPLSIDHTAHWIDEQSTTMKYRSRTRDANIGDALSETALASSARKFMDGAGMFLVLKTWQHMDNVVWKGAYDQHIAEGGGDHREAVLVANQVVESVMGSSKQKDLPQIMRAGGPAMKILTSNMTWALANWQMIATAWNQTGGGLRTLGSGGAVQMAKGLGSLATLCVIGPMLWDWMYDEMKGADMKEWQSAKGLATKAATAPVYSVMSSIPILRDLEPSVIEGRNTDGAVTGLNWMKAAQGAGAALHARHYGEATAKAVVAGAATFLPIPAAALFQAIDGYQDAQRHNAGFVGTVWRMMNGPAKR